MVELVQRKADLESNFNRVHDQLEKAYQARVAAGGDQRQPRLVAVSKTKPAQDIQIAFELGQRHFGENYAQELIEKAKQLPRDIQWHFIGHLQSNKAKSVAAIPNLFLVETVDSCKLADTLHKHRCSKNPLNIFLQVNTSGEESKHGCPPKEILNLAQHVVNSCPNLNIIGLMTIGEARPSSNNGLVEPNPDFRRLFECKSVLEKDLGLHGLELSMGMSGDYVHAIHLGSTNVRVGSTLFGERDYSTHKNK